MKKPGKSFYFIVSIFFIFISASVLFLVLLDSDKVTDLHEERGMLKFAVTVKHNNELLFTQVALFDTVNRHLLIVDVPLNMSVKLDFENKYGAVRKYFDSGRQKGYRSKVSAVTGVDFDFYLDISTDEIARIVDLTGGQQLIVVDPINDRLSGEVFMIPSGTVTLDGYKAVRYICYESENDYSEASRRRYNLMTSFYRTAGLNSSALKKSGLLKTCWKDIDTDLSFDGFYSLLQHLQYLDKEKSGFRKILGDKLLIGGEELINPYNNGRLIRAGVKQFEKAVQNNEQRSMNQGGIVIEILNGTDIDNLASNTGKIYRSLGWFDIDCVGNAEGESRKRTIVYARKESLEKANKVAEVIKCSNIKFEPYSDVYKRGIDVTIILGEDFSNGKYCREQ